MLSAATIRLSVLTKTIPPWEKNYWCCPTCKLALRGSFCLPGDKFIKLDREVKSVYLYYGIGPNSSRNKDNPIFYFTVEKDIPAQEKINLAVLFGPVGFLSEI
jgi:hypothetical protein